MARLPFILWIDSQDSVSLEQLFSIRLIRFALGVAWLVYAFHTGLSQHLNSFLSFRVFLPLSNLSYSVYLIHMSAIAFTYLVSPFPIVYNGKLVLLAHCFVQLVISYLLGGRIAFAVEMPILSIERLFLNEKVSEVNLTKLNEAEEAVELNAK